MSVAFALFGREPIADGRFGFRVVQAIKYRSYHKDNTIGFGCEALPYIIVNFCFVPLLSSNISVLNEQKLPNKENFPISPIHTQVIELLATTIVS